MDTSPYPRLQFLFGAFFHQDWDAEGDDWPDLVHNFAGCQPQSELDAVAAEVERLLSDFPDDTALDHELFDVLRCSYLPRPDLGGPTVRVWLGKIAQFLRTGAKRAEPDVAADDSPSRFSGSALAPGGGRR